MIRFSLVIHTEKGELLICEVITPTTERCMFEFPGGVIDTDELPHFETFIQQITESVQNNLSVEICDLKKLEMYFREEPFFIHTIFTAKIRSGIPTATNYKGVYWIPIHELDPSLLNIYGLHVFQKISECGYCQFLRDKQDQLDTFFENYFSKAEENLAVLDALDLAGSNNSLYMLAFKQEMVHLRASLIENAKLQKNITIQNYFKLYGRNDLAQAIDCLLQIDVKNGLTLRELIKVTVDKFIAHYDKPTQKDKEVYDYCVSLFGVNGELPLAKFVSLLNGYIMSLITQMWYDAGELGVLMSERCPMQKQKIADWGDGLLLQIIDAFKQTN